MHSTPKRSIAISEMRWQRRVNCAGSRSRSGCSTPTARSYRGRQRKFEWNGGDGGMGLARLLQIVAIISFGLQSAIAAEAISVAVPTECATESHASNIAYPFIDRIGDARFAPR